MNMRMHLRGELYNMAFVLSIFIAILLLATYGTSAALACEGGGAKPWSMLRQNYHRSGFSGCLVPTLINIERTHDVGVDSLSSPIHYHPSNTKFGFYYINGLDNILHAFKDYGGEEIWSVPLSNGPKSAPLADSTSRTLVVGSGSKLYALDLASGKTKWIFSAGGAIESSPVMLADGDAYYFGAHDGNIYKVSKNGALQWKRLIGTLIYSSPALDQNRLYVGSNNGRLYVLDTNRGGIICTALTGAPIISTPAVVRNNVYIASTNGNVYAFDKINCRKVWETKTGGPIASSPAVENNTLIIGSDDGNLYSLKTSTGALNWKVKLGSAVKASPLISTTGKIVVTVMQDAGSGSLYVLDEKSGRTIWSYKLKGKTEASPIISNDRIYVSTDEMTYIFK